MKKSYSHTVLEKVTNLIFSSNKFKQEYKASKTVLYKRYIKKNEIANFKQKFRLIRIYLSDIVAS